MKKYKTYKDSEVEWIGEIPNRWDIVKMKYIARVVRGAILRPVNDPDYFDEKGEWTYLNISDATKSGRNLTYGKLRLSELGSTKSFRVKPNNLIITASATIGKPFINRIPVCVHDGFIPLLDLDVDIDFLYYYFKNPQLFIGIGKSNTQKNIYLDEVKNMDVPLPPKREQKSIAYYLDQKTTIIDTLLEKTKQKITTLQEQRTAIINQAVTKGLTHLPPAKGGTKGVLLKDSGVEWIGEIPESWFCPKKKYICEFVLDGTHSSFARVDEGGYRLLSVRNIINNKFVFRDDDSRVSEEDFNKISSKFLVEEGDIQLAIVGATLGKVAIVEKMEERFVTQRSVATIRVKKEKCNNKFLFYYFNTSLFQRFLWQNTGFSAQPGIYLGTLQNINVPLPIIQEQEKIVDYLNQKTTKLDTLIQKEQQRINLLKEYRQSLISEVVTGKICVHNEIPVT